MANDPGYQFEHVGIHCASPKAAETTAQLFAAVFGLPTHDLPTSIYVGSSIEVTKKSPAVAPGHIAIRTTDIHAAIQDLSAKGFAVDMATANHHEGQLISIYLKQRFGGFAVHLLRR